MSNSYISLQFDELFDIIRDKKIFRELNEKSLETVLEELDNLGIICKSIDLEGNSIFRLVPNFVNSTSEYFEKMKAFESKHLYKFIIHSLYQRDNRFFTIILGAQKTKTAQIIRRIKKFLSYIDRTTKIVPILYLLNDLELKEQTVIRFINDILKQYNAELFICSSGNNNNIPEELQNIVHTNPKENELTNHIELYALNKRKMPIIISLPNNKQIKKIATSVLDEVIRLNRETSNIRYSIFIDEADNVYPNIRKVLKSYILNNDEENDIFPVEELEGIYFITASHDDFIYQFPEVREAEQLDIELDDGVNEYYRDIDHSDAQIPIKNIRQKIDESNNEFVIRIIKDYITHFTEKIYDMWRKIIVYSDFENEKQKRLAKELTKLGFCCITINQQGFILFSSEQSPENCQIQSNQPNNIEIKELKIKKNDLNLKGKSMNSRIHYLIQNYNILKSGPIIIIANKKLDRAITYHDVPRNRELPANIFTDIIVGYIKDLKKAVQVIGRINGVIGHHTQYCGKLWFWIDQRTYQQVLRQVRKVKHIEDNSIVPTPIVYLNEQADNDISIEEITDPKDIQETDLYLNKEMLINELSRILDKPVKTNAFKNCDDYIVSTRFFPKGVETKDDLTKEHRIILQKINSNNLRLFNQVGPGTSIKSYGKKQDQNFVIYPIYDDETSHDVWWCARYENPMRDKNKKVIFVGDNIIYNDNNLNYKGIVSEIIYSKNGVPSRVTLTLNDSNILTNINSQQIEKI
jgi:hypothetical protein